MKKLHSGFVAFLYILALITLILTVIGASKIIFLFIEKYIPDPLHELDYWNYDSIKFAFASLVIASPIYIVFTNKINKYLQNNIIDKDSSIRKWLTALVVLINSITIIVVLINLLISFLNGELTLSFLLKLFSILIMSIAILLYYTYELKWENSQKLKLLKKYFNIIAVILIAIPLIMSFFLLESPSHARYRKIDEKTISKVESINSAIQDFYNFQKRLPNDLDELEKKEQNFFYFKNLNTIDQNHYITYKKLSDTKYEICADFYLSSQDIYEYSYNRYLLKDFNFDKGHYCFKKEIPQKGQIPSKPIPLIEVEK